MGHLADCKIYSKDVMYIIWKIPPHKHAIKTPNEQYDEAGTA
jgi:hypothetical protein